MRAVLILLSLIVLALAGIIFWQSNKLNHARPDVPSSSLTANEADPAPIAQPASATRGASSDFAPTNVFAHNLMLRKGPSFRIYVRWLRGQMARAKRNINPSFDDPDSFYLNIQNGVIRANIGDIGNYLNASGLTNSPLKNVTLSGNGDQIKLSGSVKKIVSLPVELNGTIAALPDNRIQIRVTKINVLKVPFKALLGGFHVTLSSLFHSQSMQGIEVTGNDIFLDTQKLLPPPHIRGHLTSVRVVNPDLEEVYGNAQSDVSRVEQWRNFLRLSGGTIDFGKLSMHHVDLIMIDISKDPWFDLDLANYQQQLVNGYTRMTPQAGLQIFMPDLRDIPVNKANRSISIEWYKNRNTPPPSEVISK